MRVRGRVKYWLNNALKRQPSFDYFGLRTYFPRDCLIFRLACEQGIYEHDNLKLMMAFAREGLFIDVGASIGLMSIPMLVARPRVAVLSIEASPGTVEYLNRTRNESCCGERWAIRHCAVGASAGQMDFYSGSRSQAAYDGLVDTGRGGAKQRVTVVQNTLDNLWREAGSPDVDVVKMDIEGGEIAALAGAREMIAAKRPPILLEWNSENLRANGVDDEALLGFAMDNGYRVYSVPELALIAAPLQLRGSMRFSESFMLLAEG